jgi:hypothetical protein
MRDIWAEFVVRKSLTIETSNNAGFEAGETRVFRSEAYGLFWKEQDGQAVRGRAASLNPQIQVHASTGIFRVGVDLEISNGSMWSFHDYYDTGSTRQRVFTGPTDGLVAFSAIQWDSIGDALRMVMTVENITGAPADFSSTLHGVLMIDKEK